MKFGGKGMIQLMVLLYNWVWKNEYTPSRWREGVVVNLFKKGDNTDPGNYRGITLLNTVGKVFCKLLNDRIVGVLEKEHSISEGQAGIRKKRGCVDHACRVGRIIQGRKRAGRSTYFFFLDVKKAYDTVWRNGLWKQLSKYGIKEKMWRVLKNMTECTKGAVMLDGELSKIFDIEQGVPQGCTLSPTLFQVFINDLLEVVEAVRKGVKVGDTETSVSGMLFADDFVEDVWKGLDIDEDETLETEGLQGFKEKISVACAEREEQNLRKESKDKEGLEVYGMLKEGIGFKDYLHGPMDAGTKLKVKFRTGDIGLRERRRRHRTVDEEDDEFKCDCGFECEDRVHEVAECPLYKKEREVYAAGLGK
ncbi:unnamed protein product [Ectocarpus sp. CCAP 1310/34]|nr:unnamed protein product [Ectocarpus sp. CCAP 1310/34]